MPNNELDRRELAAREEIMRLSTEPSGEDSVTLFVNHHLDEVEKEYWLQHFGSEKPNTSDILKSLVLINSWSWDENETIDVFDFSLPNGATNYLISVRFDGEGEVESVDMES